MKPINLLVGGLTLFTAQGCKAPKQVVERSQYYLCISGPVP